MSDQGEELIEETGSIPVEPGYEAVGLDVEERVIHLANGEEVPITELVNPVPGVWVYMAGPNSLGHYIVGEARVPEEMV